MFTFLRRRPAFLAQSSRPAAPARLRPALEVLEDRCVPATITLAGAGRFGDDFIASLTPTGNGAYTAINLRSAVVGANNMAGPDTILLENGTYKLQGDLFGALNVSDSSGALTIRNNAGGVSTIDAQGKSRVFLNQASLVLNGIKVTNGFAWSWGGGILNSGALQLVNSQVVNNEVDGAFGAGRGGGVYNNVNASLVAVNSIFSGNVARGDADFLSGFGAPAQGGGVFIANGGAFFTDVFNGCSFVNNQAIGGAGVQGFGPTAPGGAAYGGGLFVIGGVQTVTLQDSTFAGNLAQGGAGFKFFGGAAWGGAAYIQDAGFANALFVNDTIASNKALGGAGPGGALGLSSGGGIADDLPANSLPQVLNTIVARNSAMQNADVQGAFASLGNNLIGDVGFSSGWSPADRVGGAGLPILDPGLDALANYGGLIPTFRLKPGSLAIDHGSNVVLGPAFGLTTDQRGQPRRMGLFVDIGAFEAGAPSLDKTYSMALGTSLNVPPATGLLANVNNPDGRKLTVTLATGPTAGVLKLQPNGAFTYTPPKTFRGATTFRFHILADGVDLGVFTATINVTPTLSR